MILTIERSLKVRQDSTVHCRIWTRYYLRVKVGWTSRNHYDFGLEGGHIQAALSLNFGSRFTGVKPISRAVTRSNVPSTGQFLLG